MTKLAVVLLSFLLTVTLALGEGDPVANEVGHEYAPFAKRIIDAALQNEGAWEKLEYLCDRIGHRLGGSPQLEKAVEWAASKMKEDGLQNVRILPVEVNHWVRGQEWAKMHAPMVRPLHMLGLGGSEGTPPQGIRAEVVVVENYDELTALGAEKVRGKIVLYNVAWEGYGRTVQYRSSGAVRAAELGAVAALVRSVTPTSLQSPHTGATNYSPNQPRIPFAAVSVEDAQLMGRLSQQGLTVEVELYMEARNLGKAMSANVIGEIPGREKPEEVVVIGGHSDSWDVGQGAHDDGGGIVVSMEVAKLLLDLDLIPRRTLRVALWTNEENGLAGGRAYREWLGDAVGSHVAAIEMDGGAEKPTGFGLSIRNEGLDDAGQARAFAIVEAIGHLLDPIGAGSINKGGGGADISPLMREGVPGLGLRTAGTHYFDWHHTDSDTLDKVQPEDLKANLAAMAVMAYILADMPEKLAP